MIVGNPGMVMLHSWVKVILRPSGRLIMIGFFVIRLLLTVSVSITKMVVAPMSAMAWLESMMVFVGRVRSRQCFG